MKIIDGMNKGYLPRSDFMKDDYVKRNFNANYNFYFFRESITIQDLQSVKKFSTY